MEISAPLSMNKGTLALFICVMFPATKYFVPLLNDATQIVFSTGAVGERGRGEADTAAVYSSGTQALQQPLPLETQTQRQRRLLGTQMQR